MSPTRGIYYQYARDGHKMIGNSVRPQKSMQFDIPFNTYCILCVNDFKEITWMMQNDFLSAST